MATIESNLPPDYFADDGETLVLPRRRGFSRLNIALAVGAIGAGAFLVGAEVQKHWGVTSSSSGTGSGFAGFAARRGAAGGGSAAGGSASRGGFGGSGGGFTAGSVTAIKGDVLYVTDTSGNTVKVVAPASTRVSKTVTANVKSINPGDTVVVVGTTQKNGEVTATSITLGGAGGFGGGGLGAGGGGATGFGGGGSGSNGSSSNGGATGFGK